MSFTGSFAAAQSRYDAMSPPDDPLRDFEPNDAQVAARTAYLAPKLLASAADAGDLLAMQTGTPAWEAFALALHTGDDSKAVAMARVMLGTAAAEEAERLAESELSRWMGAYASEYADQQTLARIKAQDVWEWLWEYA